MKWWIGLLVVLATVATPVGLSAQQKEAENPYDKILADSTWRPAATVNPLIDDDGIRLIVGCAACVAILVGLLIACRWGVVHGMQTPAQRMAGAASAAWLLAVLLHACWQSWALERFYDDDLRQHLFAALLPLIFGWSCLSLYRWAVRQR